MICWNFIFKYTTHACSLGVHCSEKIKADSSRRQYKDDLETTENDSVTLKEHFGECDGELNGSFYVFEEEFEVMEEDSTVWWLDDSAFLKHILSPPN